MNKMQHFQRVRNQICSIYNLRNTCLKSVRNFGTEKESDENPTNTEEQTEPKLGGFAQSFEKFSTINEPKVSVEPEPQSFATLLRQSKFIDLGDPEGKVVVGKVFHTVEDDLYIDFGWKFHCVCPKPKKNSSRYIRGAKVLLKIKDLELSTRFIGASTDLTLLEADCILLGLVWSPLQTVPTPNKELRSNEILK